MVESIPRVSRAGVERWWNSQPRHPRALPRPVAHVLTVLGLNADGPTYTFECRSPAGDLDKKCAPRIACECEPADASVPCPRWPDGRHGVHAVRGCRYAYTDAEDTDDAVRSLLSLHGLGRGVYFVDVHWRGLDAFDLDLLAQMRTMVGSLSAEPVKLTARPTTVTRYPGYGPEVDLRELIEESLADDPNALTWDDDAMTVTVDAQEAAKKVVAWIEKAYDVPPDQLSFTALPSRVRKPDNLRRYGVISPPLSKDVL